MKPSEHLYPIAAIREEVRRAGKITRWLRLGTAGSIVGLVVLVLVLGTIDSFRQLASNPMLNEGITVIGLVVTWIMLGGGSLLVAPPVAIAAAAAFRTWRRARVRRKLGQLSLQERVEVLNGLRSEINGDTRKIAASLLRELPKSTALLPSAAPTSRGDEPTPAADQ